MLTVLAVLAVLAVFAAFAVLTLPNRVALESGELAPVWPT